MNSFKLMNSIFYEINLFLQKFTSNKILSAAAPNRPYREREKGKEENKLPARLNHRDQVENRIHMISVFFKVINQTISVIIFWVYWSRLHTFFYYSYASCIIFTFFKKRDRLCWDPITQFIPIENPPQSIHAIFLHTPHLISWEEEER